MSYILKLFKVENVTTSDYRFYLVNKYAFIIGGFAHLCFMPIFYHLEITTLVIYNVFSMIVFIIAFILNGKGYLTSSTFIAIIEIILHAVLVVYFIGWDSGFFYYILASIPLIFSSPITSDIKKIILSLIIAFSFVALKYFSNTHDPIVHIEKEILDNIYLLNSFFITMGIATIFYYYSIASNITEEKINAERNKANQANQEKSAFLANMSHELRTPLNAIIGYSEMLKDDADEQKRTQDSKDLTKITNAGNHLLVLINSILDLTKIEAGKMAFEFQSINIPPLINDIVSTISPMIKKGSNTLTVDCDENIGHACIDQTRIKQMLFNLLSNACKFTDHGKIELYVYKENIKNYEWLCFKIVDTGIGIASDKIESLFHPFVQADVSTTRLYGGTGLGLAIIKNFIALMNGVIHVESVINAGTTFTIKLPINNGLCRQSLLQ